MTDFEKVQIGFDVFLVTFVMVGLIGAGMIHSTLLNIEYWLEQDFKTKFGYTKWWGVA